MVRGVPLSPSARVRAAPFAVLIRLDKVARPNDRARITAHPRVEWSFFLVPSRPWCRQRCQACRTLRSRMDSGELINSAPRLVFWSAEGRLKYVFGSHPPSLLASSWGFAGILVAWATPPLCRTDTDLPSGQSCGAAGTKGTIHLKGRLLSSYIGELTRYPVTFHDIVDDVTRDLLNKYEGSCEETQISQAGDFFALWRAPIGFGRPRANGQSVAGGGS